MKYSRKTKFKICIYSILILFIGSIGALYLSQNCENLNPVAIKIKAYFGNAEAQRVLGYFYMMGENVEKNSATAVEWLEKSAEKENSEAIMLLGHIYEHAQGVEKDETKSSEYYIKAAKLGHMLAQYYVGNMYYYGKYLEKDKVKALAWYACSALQQDEKDISFQSILVELLPKDMSATEVQKSKVLARYYFENYIKPYNNKLKSLDIDNKLSELITEDYPKQYNLVKE